MIDCALAAEGKKDERHCYHVTSVTAVAGRRPLELRAAGRFLILLLLTLLLIHGTGDTAGKSYSIHAP